MKIELWPSEKGKRPDSAFFGLDIEPSTLDTLIGFRGIINTYFNSSAATGLGVNGKQRLRVASPGMLYTVCHSARKKNPDMAKIADVLRTGQDLEWEIRLDLEQEEEGEKHDDDTEEFLYLGDDDFLICEEL